MFTKSRAKAGVCFQPLAKTEHTFGSEQTPSRTSAEPENLLKVNQFFFLSLLISRRSPAICCGSRRYPCRSSWCPSAGSRGCPSPPGARWRSADRPPRRPANASRCLTQILTRCLRTSFFFLFSFSTQSLVTDKTAARHSTPPPIFIAYQGDADSPAAHAPHLVR